MIDLKHVSFLISLKVDSQDRLNNLDITLKYLKHHFDTNIIIIEQDIKQKYNTAPTGVEYEYVETGEFFNRQKGLNIAARKSKTPIIAHYDADILLKPTQIEKAASVLMKNEVDLVYPYDGNFYDVPHEYHDKIKETCSLDVVNHDKCTLFNPKSVGGAVFFRQEKFWEGGAANENFQGLGYEDTEMFSRFQKLDYRIGRIAKPLFHLTHERKETSWNHNPFGQQNTNEYLRILNMSKPELLKEISTWKWKNANV